MLVRRHERGRMTEAQLVHTKIVVINATRDIPIRMVHVQHVRVCRGMHTILHEVHVIGHVIMVIIEMVTPV